MIRILNFSLIGVLIITLGVSLYSCQKNTQPEKESELDKINKCVGSNMGTFLIIQDVINFMIILNLVMKKEKNYHYLPTAEEIISLSTYMIAIWNWYWRTVMNLLVLCLSMIA